ncbi:IS3 family transposase [Gallibacterium salpingitidis]
MAELESAIKDYVRYYNEEHIQSIEIKYSR